MQLSQERVEPMDMSRLPDDFFERLLVQGRACLLLLDGLDEVANERERVLVARAVKNLEGGNDVRRCIYGGVYAGKKRWSRLFCCGRCRQRIAHGGIK